MSRFLLNININYLIMKIIPKYILLALLISCNGKKEVNLNHNNKILFSIDPDTVEYSNKINYSDVFESFHLVPLETDYNYLIAEVTQVKIFNDIIAVFDKKSRFVYLFDFQGRFINKIGKLGFGPGEYAQPNSFAVDLMNQEFMIYDRNMDKIVIYDREGSFVNEVYHDKDIYASYIEFYNGKIFLIDEPYPNQKNDNYLLRSINKNGKNETSWMKNRGIYTSLSLSTTGTLYKYKESLVFYQSYLDTIYNLKNNQLKPYITIYSEDHNKEELKKLQNINNRKETIKLLKYQKVWGLHDYIENDHMIHFIFRKEMKYNTVLYLKKKARVFSGYFVDDITKRFNQRFYTAIPDFYIGKMLNISHKNFNPEGFKALVEKGEITLCDEDKKKLERVTRESNPILIFYKLKN